MMNTALHRSSLALLLALAICAPVTVAATPTDFVVAPDRGTFYPATPLHKGDRLQVLSPYLIYGDIVSLNRCLDDCSQSQVVRVWRTRATSPDVLAYVTIEQDGDYFFSPHQIPVNLKSSGRGCWAVLAIHSICSDALGQKITEVKAEPTWFRARLSSGGWFWVRKLRDGERDRPENTTDLQASAN